MASYTPAEVMMMDDQARVLAEDDRWLEAARAAFPDWEIRVLYGNFFAVPKGTPLLPSTELDDLVLKIRREMGILRP